MRYLIIVLKNLLFLLLIISCSDNRSKSLIKEPKELQNETLNNWISFYKKSDSNFSISRFKLKSKTKLNRIKGSIYGIFDNEFEKKYKNFIIYSPDKKQYIDFDSYQWNIDENGKIQYEVDQEVNLVNVENKKVERIAFLGASNWVENSFWEHNNTIILLENGSDGIPKMEIIDLSNNNISSYVYNDILKANSNYSEERILKIIKK